MSTLRDGLSEDGFRMSWAFIGLFAIFAVVAAMLEKGIGDPGFSVFFFVVSGWIISVCVHEYGHARAAYAFGDLSVVYRGYLTLDPFRYTHPVTSILLPLLIIVLGGIGLPGAAVFINHLAIRSAGRRSLVSAAGPAGTAFVLVMLMLPIWFGALDSFGPTTFWAAWALLAMFQITSLLLNLLPIPGFDGWGILEPYLPQEVRDFGYRAAAFAQIAAVLLFLNVPQVGDAFFRLVGLIADLIGLDLGLAFAGLQLFQFWR
jgi:Zn-dependent protease